MLHTFFKGPANHDPRRSSRAQKTRRLSITAGLIVGLATLGPTWAQNDAADYPNRSIRMVVPYTPGGSADILTRMIGQGLTEKLGQPVVVDNRPGAGTLIGTENAANSPADGYTVLFSASALPLLPVFNKDMTLDVLKDLAPVTQAVQGEFLIAVPASLPVNNLQELIAHSKKNPQTINYSSPGITSSPFMTIEYLKSQTDVDWQHIPYQGSSVAVQALLRGDVSLTADPAFTLRPHIESGKLRGLAVTGANRSKLLPDVPTVAESGVPGFNISFWMGYHVPAGTPKPIVDKLSATIAEILHEPKVKEQAQRMGLEPVGNTPDEFGKLVEADLTRWAELAKSLNLSSEQAKKQ